MKLWSAQPGVRHTKPQAFLQKTRKWDLVAHTPAFWGGGVGAEAGGCLRLGSLVYVENSRTARAT